ncbi:MAG TPA: DUF503 domain-containing protein [Fimbriiglobus sp.]|jgi:hypothetical protein
MYVGSLHVRLLLRQSRTLKDKRQVARSMLDKLRNSFNVSAMEVDNLDDVRQLTIGIALVGMESESVTQTLQSIQNALRSHPVAEYADGQMHVDRAED